MVTNFCNCVRQVPESGKIYAFNEGNYGGWEQGLQDYMMSLKDAEKHGGKPYSARFATPCCLTCCIAETDRHACATWQRHKHALCIAQTDTYMLHCTDRHIHAALHRQGLVCCNAQTDTCMLQCTDRFIYASCEPGLKAL